MRNIVKKMIKPLIFSATACLVCMGSSAWAGVSLNLPKNVNIVAENGKKIKIVKKASLPDGENQIVIQFQGEVGLKRNDTDFLTSDAFVIRFNASNQELELVIPHIGRRLEFDIWNKDPDIRILDKADREINFKFARLKKNGFQVFRDYDVELQAFNQTGSPAAMPSLVNRQPAVPVYSAPAFNSGTTGYQPQGNNSGMVEHMLEYWYQQADEATRERFRQRINNQ